MGWERGFIAIFGHGGWDIEAGMRVVDEVMT